MATYRLPFGYMDWPEPEANHAEPDPGPVDLGRSSRLMLKVPATLRQRIERSAAIEGLSSDAWIERALARSVDPRLDTP